jgi:hypothetical protein
MKLTVVERLSWPVVPGEVRLNTHGPGECHARWSNCDGRHWEVICPGGDYWDINSRASNCTMRDDGTHRCWVVHGEPPNVHVDKSGHTCGAGAGSIQTSNWHGFLHNGELA